MRVRHAVSSRADVLRGSTRFFAFSRRSRRCPEKCTARRDCHAVVSELTAIARVRQLDEGFLEPNPKRMLRMRRSFDDLSARQRSVKKTCPNLATTTHLRRADAPIVRSLLQAEGTVVATSIHNVVGSARGAVRATEKRAERNTGKPVQTRSIQGQESFDRAVGSTSRRSEVTSDLKETRCEHATQLSVRTND